MSPVRFLVAPRNPKTLRVSKLASSERCFLRDLTYLSGLKKSPDRLQKVGKSSIESHPSTTKSTTKNVAIVSSKSLGHLKLMAKISVTLDTRPKKDGSRAVIIAFIHKRYRKQTKLGVCLLPDQWDEVSCKVTSKHPQHKALNLKLKSIIASVEAIIARYVGWDVEGETIYSEIEQTIFPDRAEKKKIAEAKAAEEATLAIAEKNSLTEVAKRCTELKKPSTRLTYERTLKHIETFINNGQSNCLEEVNKAWLTAFDNYLAESNPSPNARALHLRNLRAVFNYAIDEELTTNYPFRRFKIKTVKTAKRNLSVVELRQIFNYAVEDWQVVYRDMFKLSFMLMGINFVDMLNLQKSNMHRGRIEFNRHKTARLYSMKVEPEALELIRKYAGTDFLLSIMDGRQDYLQYIRQTNHALKCIGMKSVKGRAPQGEALFPDITTYWARHTWATIARSIGISIDDIALSLGHGDGHNLTHIYIEDDLRKVDEANRKVLDWVLYGKKDGIVVDPAFKVRDEKPRRGRPRKIS